MVIVCALNNLVPLGASSLPSTEWAAVSRVLSRVFDLSLSFFLFLSFLNSINPVLTM